MALLKTREINLPGRSLLMTLTLSSSDLLSGVPPRHHQTSGWTHHKGRINHKISHLMCLFMVGPILMDLITHHPCPSLILMTYWGEHFSYLWMRNGERKRATISEHVKDLYQQQVSREDQLRFKLKIDGDQRDDLISYNQLMEYLEDKTDTGPLEDGLYRFKCIKDHKGPYTSSDPEYNGIATTYLLSGRLGSKPGNH